MESTEKQVVLSFLRQQRISYTNVCRSGLHFNGGPHLYGNGLKESFDPIPMPLFL